MFKLDDNFLIELGLGSLPATEKNKMLAHIYETLEMKVGMRLAEKMSNEQLDEFEGFINQNDEAGALKWLETNFPNYKQVVAEELEKLKAEIKQVAPQIIAQAASTVQPGSPVAQPQPVQAYPAGPAAPYQQPMMPPQDMQPAAPMPNGYGQPAAAMPPASQQPQINWQQPTPSQQPAYPSPTTDFGSPAGSSFGAPSTAPTQYPQPVTPPPAGNPYADPYAPTMNGGGMQPSYPSASSAPMSAQPYDPMPPAAVPAMPTAPVYPAHEQPSADFAAPYTVQPAPNNGFGSAPASQPSMTDFSSPQPLPQQQDVMNMPAQPIATQPAMPTSPQPAEPYSPPPAEPYQPPR